MKKTTGKIINRLSLHRNHQQPRKIMGEMQLVWLGKGNNSLTIHFKLQKQPSRGVPRKRCSLNMQQFYRRTPMPKCDFNKVALQLYWNRTSAWRSPVNLLQIFRTSFPRNTSGRLLLKLETTYNFFVSWRNLHW